MTEVPRLERVDAALAGQAPLPRDNGELVFEEPWQARALGMGVVALERTGTTWAEFRQHGRKGVDSGQPEPDTPEARPFRNSLVSARGAGWNAAIPPGGTASAVA